MAPAIASALTVVTLIAAILIGALSFVVLMCALTIVASLHFIAIGLHLLGHTMRKYLTDPALDAFIALGKWVRRSKGLL